MTNTSSDLSFVCFLQQSGLQHICDHVTRLAIRMLGASYGQLDIVNGRELVTLGSAGSEALMNMRNAGWDDSYSPLVIQHASSLAVNTVAAHPVLRAHQATRTYGIKSYMGVPLYSAGKIVGTMAVFDTVPHEWTAADVATFTELTALVEAEIADRRATYDRTVESSLAAFHTVGSLLHDGIVLTNERDEIVYANQPISTASGYPLDFLLGKVVWDVLAPASETADEAVAEPWPPLDTRSVVRFVSNSGDPWWAEIVITPRNDSAGRSLGRVVRVNDVTEYQHLQTQFTLSQRRESVGQLAIGLTHDFNNLLTIVLGSAQLAMMDIHSDTQAYKDLNEIYQAATRAARLTRQILGFARKQPTAPQLVNTNEVLIDVSKILRWALRSDIELVVLPHSDTTLIKASTGQIEQALVNLVLYGQRMLPAGGTIHIELIPGAATLASNTNGSEPKKYVSICVTTTSKGDTFDVATQRVEATASHYTDDADADLLLASSLVIAEQHGGYIEYAAQEGRGTIARMYLPQIEALSVLDVEAFSVDTLPYGNEIILLVEDEPAMRELIARFLRTLGYTVLEAAHGDAALRLTYRLSSRPIDMVIADLVMPQMGGEELATHLQLRYPTIKILFMSGYTDREGGEYRPIGSHPAFLRKPFLLNLLAHTVRQVLDG